MNNPRDAVVSVWHGVAKQADGQYSTGQFNGTAFFISQSLLITAKHVLHDHQTGDLLSGLALKMVAGQIQPVPFSAANIIEHEGDDIALINLAYPFNGQAFCKMQLGKLDPIGQDVTVIGIDKNALQRDETKETVGKSISDLGYTIAHKVKEGFSGGLICLTANKQAIGVMIQCNIQGEQESLFLPLFLYKDWLAQHNQKLADAELTASLNKRLDQVDHQNYLNTQKTQIQQLLNQLADSKLLHEIQQAAKLPATKTADQLHLHLCGMAVLDVLDILLRAIAQTLKHDKTPSTIQQMLDLFQLFVSLLAPKNPALKQAIIRLSAYSKIGAELELAALYDTTPSYCEQQNEVCGKYAIDGSQLVRESGWDTAATLNEALNNVALSVTKKPLKDPVNAFERRKLNTTIQQRQNRSINQLHRFELNLAEADSQNNPLLQEDFCLALNAVDCLPDLPISHYGEQLSLVEADLSAKIEQLFDLLKSAGQLP